MKLERGERAEPHKKTFQSIPWEGEEKPNPSSQRQSRERDRGGGKQKGQRSASNSRECWGCHEIVKGDHYSSNCPKAKKEESGRPITPYPHGRSPSKERGGACQGGETHRMLRGSFGCKPWVKKDSAEEDEEDKEPNEEKIGKWLREDAMEELMKKELENRREDGNTTCLVEESEYGPHLETCQLDQDWKEQQADKAEKKTKLAPLTVQIILRIGSWKQRVKTKKFEGIWRSHNQGHMCPK